MATSVTKWTRGAHTIANGGKSFSSIARECTMTWDTGVAGGRSILVSEPFDWAVEHDFTIVVNVDATNHSDGTGLDMEVQGSGTGDVDTAAEWDVLASFANCDEDAKVRFFVYDIDANGRAPFMRLSCRPSTDVGASSVPMRFFIIPHKHSH